MKPYSTKQYTLRDTIHSDIHFDARFFALISTAEFQRLARIKQLSSEYLLFPAATHTRFAHSIGTYHVMQQLIARLERALDALGIAVSEEQRELALCSALLHDLGHGPFSHTFESILEGCSHEQWTVRILRSEQTEIHRALVTHFGAGFIERLVRVLQVGSETDPMLALIHQLISSQMDADRMDYLLRDSYFTGVRAGMYDLSRIIESIDVAEASGTLQICVNEKYLSSIEEYLMARFYMYKEVYQHPLKRQMEHIMCKIFQRVKELSEAGVSVRMDALVAQLLTGTLSVPEYLALDDHVLLYHIASWRTHSDETLSLLCKALIDRKKFKRYRSAAGEHLRTRVDSARQAQNLPQIHWDAEYGYIDDCVTIPVYDAARENIWVKQQSGALVDVSEASYLLSSLDSAHRFARSNEYYHPQLLAQTLGAHWERELILGAQ